MRLVNGDIFTREIAAGGLFVVVAADATNEIIDVFGSSDPSAPAGPAAPSDELTGVLASVAHSLERHLPQINTIHQFRATLYFVLATASAW